MTMGTLILYNIDDCGYCAMVRNELKRLNLDYETIDVPWSHSQRTEVFEISGQTTVPVLVDGEIILDDEYDIIDHLKKTYSPKTPS
jgi:glutaredoxin 3